MSSSQSSASSAPSLKREAPPPPRLPVNPSADWDATVIGGALAGSAAAIRILELNPALRVLIVESGAAHKRRVGESTAEVSTFFLVRTLGLGSELNQDHLSKQGLGFWFANPRCEAFQHSSEFGPKFEVLNYVLLEIRVAAANAFAKPVVPERPSPSPTKPKEATAP